MSLDWNISDCADVEALKADTPDGWPVTEGAVWLCMIVGVPSITEKTAEKFWLRVHEWEAVNGPILTNGHRYTPEDVTRRIGLRTNASSLTDAAWRKKVQTTLREAAQRSWDRAAKEAAK